MAEIFTTGNKNEKVGEVVSTKMVKTIVVQVTNRSSHPVYKRIVTKRTKFYAHDEQETAKPGDIVRIVTLSQEFIDEFPEVDRPLIESMIGNFFKIYCESDGICNKNGKIILLMH